MRWTLLCRVVDNFGDVGFAWRLAADLAGRGERVRLGIDDARALAWMAPAGTAAVEVVDWADATAIGSDVLVETFGCGWPERVAGELTSGRARPVCVNVEHLSAEPYVARSHGLPSPRFACDGAAIPNWFFFPGFTHDTGGLLREPGLLGRRQAFGDGRAWLAARGIERAGDERCVALFCYPEAPVEALLDALSATPTLLLLTAGPATERALAALDRTGRRGRLRAVALPPLAQPDFDRLLWSCDLAFVRGEDSLVRAFWAGAPWVWQAYRQEDGAHQAKVRALLDLYLADGAPPAFAHGLRRLFDAWNGFGGNLSAALQGIDPAQWAARSRRWRDRLADQADLTTRLLAFVASRG
jgi:uncharacterized repeat protein (TIGR03837 family)